MAGVARPAVSRRVSFLRRNTSLRTLQPQLRGVEAGVRLVPGDDYGVWPLAPGAYSAEPNGGEMTAVTDLGTVAPGKVAGFIILDNDPCRDIRALGRPRNIGAVFKNGESMSGALSS